MNNEINIDVEIRVVTFEQIAEVLRGIDQHEVASDDGWWSSNEGAAFGAGKLAEIRRLFYPVEEGKPAVL